jgi:hypothetical protein
MLEYFVINLDPQRLDDKPNYAIDSFLLTLCPRDNAHSAKWVRHPWQTIGLKMVDKR